MNGIHDMGGMHGFGPVQPEPNEPVFHAPWEARVLAMTRAMHYATGWSVDKSRATQERLAPRVYLAVSYYQRWLLALEQNAIEAGLITRDEIDAGRSLRPGKPLPNSLRPATVKSEPPLDFSRAAPRSARFKPGDTVRTINDQPTTHTRLPRYARGRLGTVEAIRGYHVYPDAMTTGRGEDPHWLYTVVFAGKELWGADAEPALEVSVEAWEPYLLAA
jgi:nitrile hydratase beta subunit